MRLLLDRVLFFKLVRDDSDLSEDFEVDLGGLRLTVSDAAAASSASCLSSSRIRSRVSMLTSMFSSIWISGISALTEAG